MQAPFEFDNTVRGGKSHTEKIINKLGYFDIKVACHPSQMAGGRWHGNSRPLSHQGATSHTARHLETNKRKTTKAFTRVAYGTCDVSRPSVLKVLYILFSFSIFVRRAAWCETGLNEY